MHQNLILKWSPWFCLFSFCWHLFIRNIYGKVVSLVRCMQSAGDFVKTSNFHTHYVPKPVKKIEKSSFIYRHYQFKRQQWRWRVVMDWSPLDTSNHCDKKVTTYRRKLIDLNHLIRFVAIEIFLWSLCLKSWMHYKNLSENYYY